MGFISQFQILGKLFFEKFSIPTFNKGSERGQKGYKGQKGWGGVVIPLINSFDPLITTGHFGAYLPL